MAEKIAPIDNPFTKLAPGGGGGFGLKTRAPFKSKMEQRAERRREAFEKNQEATKEARDKARAERKERFQPKRGPKFERGGMVKAQCREYGK